ncbi:LytR/AlgR family response regulator transcription factor [Polaribacter sp. Hel1_85]|uniref:LytR/AlgR family response regulator transcription factor n=1 Tax=Polaribacter sp. Hel1_85 TaxID=1250005 RepID=UPI00052E1A87|nr:LytTR family DNA-binding domain-containing protein [Polaribacter sp. Hel1_85]KGL63203.1 two-component system response regulator, LytR/AlgR family [Polaribacter sp. Hel1_85]
MVKLTSFVVEDNSLALDMLVNDITTHHKEIEIIGTAKSVVEAAKLLQKKQPDILFLDIMLGDGTGFDLLEIFPNLTSKIIFVTASDEFAIRAFKFAAIDYILKPYSNEDLESSIKKAKQQIEPQKEQLNILKQAVTNPKDNIKKISLHTQDKIIIVNIEDIIRCKSDNNYTTFYFKDKSKILVSKTLKYYSDMLNTHGFLRVHQSHLINKSQIKEFIKSDGGYIILKDASNIPVSVRKKGDVIEFLNSF